MSETWKPIPGCEGYEASDLGRIRSWRPRNWRCSTPTTPRILAQCDAGQGYLVVSISQGSKAKTQRVNRLVLLAFVGPCPEGMEGCHGNGDRGDNRLENLRWDTHQGNQVDRLKHGTDDATLSETEAEQAVVHARAGMKAPQTADLFQVGYCVASDLVHGRTWKHLTGGSLCR
jgi:hypothetical protein